MNSRWNWNLIIFTMNLVSTYSKGWIKIRVFGPTRSQPRSNLVKVAKSLRSSGLMKNYERFYLRGFWLSVNLGLTKGILVILAEKAFWVLWCPNGLHHVILDVLVVPCRENNIFGFFGVLHANRGQTKYSIKTHHHNNSPLLQTYYHPNSTINHRTKNSKWTQPPLATATTTIKISLQPPQPTITHQNTST